MLSDSPGDQLPYQLVREALLFYRVHPLRSLHLYVIMLEVAVNDKSQASLTVKWFCPASPVFPTLGLIGHCCCQKWSTLDRSPWSPGEDTWNKYNKTSVTICMMTKEFKPVGSVLKHARIISPHWCQWHEPHSDAVEITLKKLASLASVRLRHVIMAPNRKTTTHLLWRHEIRQTRHLRFWRCQISKMVASFI